MTQGVSAIVGMTLSTATTLALAQSGAQKSQSSPSMEMHQSMMKGAKDSMAMKPSGNMDHDFVMMMRHHHQMGVQMAEREIRDGKDEKAKEFARNIVKSQNQEIKEFDEWLKHHGSKN